MKRILVTGSTGLVGSEAVDFFREKGWEVIGIDNNGRAGFFGTPVKYGYREDIQFHQIDIRNRDKVEELFEAFALAGQPFDAIIHAAAQPSHDYSKEHVLEDFHTNATGTVNLLEAARKYSPQAVFVHVSTDKVYGWGMNRKHLREKDEKYDNDVPFAENTPFEPPLSPFGVSKLAADFYAQEYAAQGWLTTGIFRPGCITGRRHEGAEQHGFLAYLTKCIKEGTTYQIYGYEGKQVRDQIHAFDLVSAFDSFIRNPKSGAVYNIGGGYERAVSPLSAGKLISEKLGKEFKYEILDEPRFGDRIWDVHDVSKFRDDYPGWDYEYGLTRIIDDLCS